MESFYRIEPTINIVTHENIPSGRNRSTLAEQLEQVVELAVDIAADSDGCGHRLHITLLNQDLFDFGAQLFEVPLTQAFALVQLCEPLVYLRHFTIIYSNRKLIVFKIGRNCFVFRCLNGGRDCPRPSTRSASAGSQPGSAETAGMG